MAPNPARPAWKAEDAGTDCHDQHGTAYAEELAQASEWP